GLEPAAATLEILHAAPRDEPAEVPGLPPASAGGLREPLTSFVGREEELDLIAARLTGDECRLLTLVGPGGVGKTRLALRAAERVGGRGAGGRRPPARRPLPPRPGRRRPEGPARPLAPRRVRAPAWRRPRRRRAPRVLPRPARARDLARAPAAPGRVAAAAGGPARPARGRR